MTLPLTERHTLNATISTPTAKILTLDQNARTDIVSLTFKTMGEVSQFLKAHSQEFTSFADIRQSQWIKKPVVIISLKTQDKPKDTADITEVLTKIFADIVIRTAPRVACFNQENYRPSGAIEPPASQRTIVTPHAGILHSRESWVPDIVYLRFNTLGHAKQFLGQHEEKFAEFATNSRGRLIRISLLMGSEKSVADIQTILTEIFPSIRLVADKTQTPG